MGIFLRFGTQSAFNLITQANGEGGGMQLPGYNDDDADPNNHYWIVLNSWGTSSGPSERTFPHEDEYGLQLYHA
jgi:hypothetical protein